MGIWPGIGVARLNVCRHGELALATLRVKRQIKGKLGEIKKFFLSSRFAGFRAPRTFGLSRDRSRTVCLLKNVESTQRNVELLAFAALSTNFAEFN